MATTPPRGSGHTDTGYEVADLFAGFMDGYAHGTPFGMVGTRSSVDGKMSAGSLELDRLETPVMFSNFDDNALSLDRARVLQTAFEKLSPTQKQVIELAYFEGLSQTEMAERMKQPLGTIKTWVRSALKTLRDDIVAWR